MHALSEIRRIGIGREVRNLYHCSKKSEGNARVRECV